VVAVRRMTPADLDFAMTVKQAAGWNQTEADWRAHLDLDPAGCFVAELAGEPVGTAVLTSYGTDFGWIGMVLVHPAFRRRGAAAALLDATRAYARERGLARVRLDATPDGRRVYLTQGFVDEYALTRYRGRATVPPGAAAPLGSVAELVEWDAARFGTDRGGVLRELVGRPGSRTFTVHKGGLAGYVVTRRGAAATQLGPWLADDRDTAAVLLHTALAGVDGEVIVDVPLVNRVANDLVTAAGLVVERGYTRMGLPAGLVAEDNAVVHATAGADRG
jgi:ribosomal protein S18 acetylase RimI-like enzyme